MPDYGWLAVRILAWAWTVFALINVLLSKWVYDVVSTPLFLGMCAVIGMLVLTQKPEDRGWLRWIFLRRNSE